MRRYLQGTLDYACGIYAVINALACTHGLELARARLIFQESLIAFSEYPDLWRAFVRNDTDHYWVVRWLLDEWCSSMPWRLEQHWPFADPKAKSPGKDSVCRQTRKASFSEGGLDSSVLPPSEKRCLTKYDGKLSLYLPENEPPRGPLDHKRAKEEAAIVWAALRDWFTGKSKGERVAVLRFHRFLPGMEMPVVSHWTTAARLEGSSLTLHDASSEKQALFVLDRDDLTPMGAKRCPVRIVPESLILLERNDF